MITDFIAACRVCRFAYEPSRAIYPGDVPVCPSCERDGWTDGECVRCHEPDAIDARGLCGVCGTPRAA